MIKTIQIESGVTFTNGDNDDLLRAAGVKKIHKGWYTILYRGVIPDNSTVVSAFRNRKGQIRNGINNYQKR